MNRGAIQQNRDPIGYTKRTRRYPPINEVEKAINRPKQPSQIETTPEQIQGN